MEGIKVLLAALCYNIFMQLYRSKRLKAKHAFCAREGGVSASPYASLNVAYHVGDRRDDVMTNHKLLAFEVGYDFKKLVFMNQIHSSKVVVIDEESFSVPSCDALVTDIPDTPLMVMSADCAPVLLHDAVHGVIAAVHAGRAGAFGNIVKNVIQTMQERYGCKATDIQAAIGPRICASCYEVSQKEIDEAKALGYDFACKGNHIDIDAILEHQLKESGVLAENIDFLPHCTKCEKSEFFSYRADKVTGRNASVIVL